VLDVGEAEDGTVYLAMELADGEPVDALVRRGGVAPSIAVDILAQVARALVAIHATGLVHRDLSSRNVLVAWRAGAPFVKVLDFGIAQTARFPVGGKSDEGGDATFANPVFSAPEQLAGGGVIGAGGFCLENYRVEPDEVFAPPGEAFRHAMSSVNQARTYVASMCVAMVESCLDTAIVYGRERQAFGAPLSANQGWRWMAGDIATDAQAARLLAERAADLIVRGEDAVLASAHAKKFATRMAVQRISDACQLMGAAGLRDCHPFLRHLASARVASYTDGSTEMQNERIAAIIVGPARKA
jgi:hypothetical protein